jgi:hypothetical protein
MPELPGHDRRETRRAKRRGRRLVRSGDMFTSDELDREEVELERRDTSGDEPEQGGTEPWGTDEPTGEMADRLRAYREFLTERGEGNGP